MWDLIKNNSIFVHCSDINQIQIGIGDKLGNFCQWFSCFLAGFIIGFIYGWKLTLVILSVTPLMVIATAAFGQVSLQRTLACPDTFVLTLTVYNQIS